VLNFYHSQDRKGSISNSAEQAKKTSSAKQDDKRKTEKYPNNMVRLSKKLYLKIKKKMF